MVMTNDKTRESLKNRYDFVLFFDCENGNPNGDPDAGNMPRTDAETSVGLVTDVCIKRKVRNYVEKIKNDIPSYKIFIKEILNPKIIAAVEEAKEKKASDVKTKAQEAMCRDYYDVRTFGAVMSTGKKDESAGVVRGPVQLCFGKSIDPVIPQEITITRIAVTNEKDAEKGQTMGKKYLIPYGLYRMEGYISANLAEKTGFDESDLELFWEALTNMFEDDHSAARGKMITRRLIVFKHDSKLGNCHSHKLFERVSVRKLVSGVDAVAKSFSDYEILVDTTNLPSGVKVIEKID
jgi:CRISPR-associated protein Csd2